MPSSQPPDDSTLGYFRQPPPPSAHKDLGASKDRFTGTSTCKYSGKSIRQQVYVKHRIVVVGRPRSNSLAGSVSSEGIPPEAVYPPLKYFPKLPFWPWVIFKNGYTEAEGSGSHPASAPHRRRVEPSDGYWLFPVRAPGSDAHPTAQPPLETAPDSWATSRMRDAASFASSLEN